MDASSAEPIHDVGGTANLLPGLARHLWQHVLSDEDMRVRLLEIILNLTQGSLEGTKDRYV